jgi:hypothetical protein
MSPHSREQVIFFLSVLLSLLHSSHTLPQLWARRTVGEVRLPELVDGGGLVPELVRRLDHNVSWAGDEIMRL